MHSIGIARYYLTVPNFYRTKNNLIGSHYKTFYVAVRIGHSSGRVMNVNEEKDDE